MFAYPVTIKKDSNGTWLVSFPDVPEAVTFGDTRSEALAHAVEALEAGLSFYIDENKELPKPSSRKDRPVVSPSLTGEMKLSLYQTMRQKRIRKAELARRMGVKDMQIYRLLDLTHASRIDQLEAAFAALGCRAHVALEAA